MATTNADRVWSEIEESSDHEYLLYIANRIRQCVQAQRQGRLIAGRYDPLCCLEELEAAIRAGESQGI